MSSKINTLLLLPIHWYRCCCQFTGTVVDSMPPPPSYPIPSTRCLSSADTSVVVFVFFVRICLLRRLHCRHRFLGPVVDPPPPPSLSPIPRTRCLFLVPRRRLRHRCWFLRPVFLRRRRCCCRQFPGILNTLPPPSSETFYQARPLLCFLFRRLHHYRQFIGLIFLCRHLWHGRQFLSPVIATP